MSHFLSEKSQCGALYVVVVVWLSFHGNRWLFFIGAEQLNMYAINQEIILLTPVRIYAYVLSLVACLASLTF